MLNLLHVEVCQNIDSYLTETEIKELVQKELDLLDKLDLNKSLLSNNFHYEKLKTHVRSICCSCEQQKKQSVQFKEMIINIHVYRLNQESIAIETMHNGDGEEISATSHWILPSEKFYELWENLFYNPGVKEKLLNLMETAMMYSERKVNPHIISWNKVVLLYGPPGTGKTSLCKALAQKITIRLGKKFNRGQLIEINSHSLFSKWFSESGKLVMNLFNEIKLLLEDPKALVFILMDEVESLAHARKACTTGSDPSDSIRVVNALLTQLDNIKSYPNVLILTTSNLTEAIDLAFVDRADIKLHIPLPNEEAVYKIYINCINELMRTELIQSEEIDKKSELKLLNLSIKSIGMSGRALKKIPFLAHALFIQEENSTLSKFLTAMKLAIQWQIQNGSDSEDMSHEKKLMVN